MLSEKLVVAEAHCSHIKLSIMEQVWSRQTSDASTPHATPFPAPSPSHPFPLLISEFPNSRSSLILAAP